MCGGGGIMGLVSGLLGGGQASSAPTPTQPTVDPEAERRKAEADAASKTNDQLLADARRKRAQKGLLAGGEDTGASVLATGGQTSAPPASTVLGSGGA